MTEPVKMMETVVALDYEQAPTLVARQYSQAIREKRLLAHQCPKCQRIYLPPRGYCPLCVEVTGKEHEVEVPDRGVLVTFTIAQSDPKITGEAAQRFARGTVMLDGTPIGQMGEVLGVPLDEVHTGMRLKAVWSERRGEDADAGRGWGVAGIRGWEPTGEPDAPPDEVQALIAKAMAGLG